MANIHWQLILLLCVCLSFIVNCFFFSFFHFPDWLYRRLVSCLGLCERASFFFISINPDPQHIFQFYCLHLAYYCLWHCPIVCVLSYCALCNCNFMKKNIIFAHFTVSFLSCCLYSVPAVCLWIVCILKPLSIWTGKESKASIIVHAY